MGQKVGEFELGQEQPRGGDFGDVGLTPNLPGLYLFLCFSFLPVKEAIKALGVCKSLISGLWRSHAPAGGMGGNRQALPPESGALERLPRCAHAWPGAGGQWPGQASGGPSGRGPPTARSLEHVGP